MTDLTDKWVNIYKSKKHGSYRTGTFCYKTKEEAVKALSDKKNYLTTVNIEDVLNLQTQNTELKELLKRCKRHINASFPEIYRELLQEINQALGEE